MRYRLITLLLSLLFLTACTEDAENTYSRHRAFFRFQPVSAVAPLNNALNSMGEFCTVRQNATHYLFNGSAGEAKWQKTGVDEYNAMQAIGGFIIGKATLSDIGTNVFPLLCFDLACSNCYDEANIARNLSLEENGRAVCTRCHRTYDLNNQGIIVEGNKGKKLFRYRIQYSSDLVIVQN